MLENRIYRLLKDLNRLTYVNIKGKDVPIHFSGGVIYPRRINGSYSTSDPDIQKALENDHRNGEIWKCISKIPLFKKPEVETLEGETAEVPETPAKTRKVPEIKTVQDAKEYLASRLDGISKATLTNKAKVLEVAARYNIIFPNLP